MKKYIIFGLSALIFILTPSWKVFAADLCSKSGYTVLTVNGIFTDEKGAKDNSLNLKRKLVVDTFNTEPLGVDYVYNESHLAGLSDLVDVVAAKLFYETSDYDLTNILNDASKKVTTQKVLLVAHSQGNFYANDFYDSLASRPGGIPSESIGVYGVADPSSRVAGDGKYITSSNDKVINLVRVKGLVNVLKPNVNLPATNPGMFPGHDFSDIYLKYDGNRIVSDIKDSLSKLKNNDEQDSQENCIAPQKVTFLHKLKGVGFAVADPTALGIKYSMAGTYNAGVFLAKGISNVAFAMGNVVSNLFANVLSTVPENENSNPVTEVLPENEIVNDEDIFPAREDQIPPNVSVEDENDLALSNSETEEAIAENTSQQGATHGGQNTKGGNNGGGGGTPDTVAPVISIIGSDPMDVIKGTTFVDPGATALDAVDGSVTVTSSGVVDTTTVGAYAVTYTATDAAGNVATLTRTVNVVLDTGAPVITLNGASAEIVIKNSVYVDPGATATDAIDGAITVVTSGTVDTTAVGIYTITYTATDSSGNITTATRIITVSSYKYIPKYKFGNENGDGNDWQAWWFNGSNVYDWSDTYVNNYLREQFKIKTVSGVWCSQCLQRGVFNHNPQKGFESADLTISTLESNPQNNGNDIVYDVALQWDSSGYTYTISHGGATDATGYTNVTNMNNDMWVGWDGSFNNFQTFPSGNWQGVVSGSVMSRTGGSDMVLEPYPVYQSTVAQINPTLSIPNKGAFTTSGISPTRGRMNLTPFNFEVIYTDPNNNPPQNIKLYAINKTTNTTLAALDMQKVSPGAEDISDGSFTNGEAYTANNVLYDTGEYEYYFGATDNLGNFIRLPESGVYRFQAIPSTYTYIPKYTFGTGNGDGNDWQAWGFNGSSVFDWSDTYLNNYLKEQFKIKANSGTWCSLCLQRGIFNHDPQKGFETYDFTMSSLENNPQNNGNDTIYDVALQWDASGYTYTISHSGVTDATGHTNVTNMNNDMWVGWDGSFNNFQTFPSGTWIGSSTIFPTGYVGGWDMMIKPFPVYVYSGPVLSNEKKILTFDFAGLSPSVTGAVDESAHTVSLSVPFGTNLTNLVPTITISTNAGVSPLSGVTQDFTNPVTYTVTAENSSTQNYIVTVTVLPAPPDTTAPSVTSYTFNGVSSDVTVNPSASNPLAIVINASENVNWASIKIERDSDHTFYKMFMSDSGGCVDGTNTCTKSWDGLLSSGGLLQSGVYKIKLHMKDLSNNEFYDYLTPYVINVDTTI